MGFQSLVGFSEIPMIGNFIIQLEEGRDVMAIQKPRALKDMNDK